MSQYSEGASDGTEKPRRTGYPAAGYDDFSWRSKVTNPSIPARSLPRPRWLALFGERLQPLLGVFGHRQQGDLGLGIGDAFIERHRGDRAHGVFAAPDRGRRLVGDAAYPRVELGVEFRLRHHIIEQPGR